MIYGIFLNEGILESQGGTKQRIFLGWFRVLWGFGGSFELVGILEGFTYMGFTRVLQGLWKGPIRLMVWMAFGHASELYAPPGISGPCF